MVRKWPAGLCVVAVLAVGPVADANPGRTMANSASGRVPWHREGRPLNWREE